jgi:hypothetical protein
MYERKVFFARVRQSLFRGKMSQKQVDGMEVMLRWAEGYKQSDLFLPQLAYIFATAYHETGARMQPVRETFAKTDDEAIARLDRAYAAGQLPWVTKPYWYVDSHTGQSYFGRGLVQLTHKENYKKVGSKLDKELVMSPENALEPNTACDILFKGMLFGWFTGFCLGDYITEGHTDYRQARRVVNGMERADLIYGYAVAFEDALVRAQVEGEENPVDWAGTTGTPARKSTTVLASFLQLVGAAVLSASAHMLPALPASVVDAYAIVSVLLSGYIIGERIRHSKEDGV